MNQKRVLSFIGLFIIALVVSMPFYVADVYAVSVSVTKNQGEAGVAGFINADGDVWTVEATIAGAGEIVEPEKVKIKVGAREAVFNSCSEGVTGTVCAYTSPLPNGVTENIYPFNVLYYFIGLQGVEGSVSSPSSAIRADGSAPEINFVSIKQEAGTGKIKLDFSVEDKPDAYCAGLEKVEVIDAESGEVLQAVNDLSGDCDFDFVEDKGGVLEASLEGEGRKSLKIKAADKLGHESSKSKSFELDFVAPVIDDEIVFADFGEFIGKLETETDIKVNVAEGGNSLKAKAYSEQAELDGDEAACELQEGKLWTCIWKDVKVISSESISVKVMAADGMGNEAEKTLSQSFVVDDAAPEAVFFGTERTYGDESYVKAGKNRVVLKVEEQGAGISEEGIKANLAVLGGEKFDAPDKCEQTETTYDCYWDVAKSSFTADSVSIGLSQFKDKVGNEGKRPDIEVVVDKKGPEVKEMEVYGFGEAGKKNYFQSNDILRIEMEAAEKNGLLILVDLNDAVMDAETLFPEFSFGDLGDYKGWAMFTEEDCTRKVEAEEEEAGGEKWVCELEISEEIRSGPDSSVELKVEVYDTAGNKAKWVKEPKNVKGEKGKYTFELLGVAVEEEPDFWEVKGISYAPEFIDLDTTNLINTRLSAKVELRSDEAIARKIEIDLLGCSPVEEEVGLTRTLLYGGESEQARKATPTIVLEFETFDAKEKFGEKIEAIKEETGEFETLEVPFVCGLVIYSQVGKKAIGTAEKQEVNLTVSFGFSELGAQDENLEKKIKEAKEHWMMDLFALVGLLEKIRSLVTILCKGVNAFDSAITIVLGVGAVLGFHPLTKGVGSVLCHAGANTRAWGWGPFYEIVDPLCSLFSCRKSFSFLENVRNPLGDWAAKVDEFYKKAGYAQIGIEKLYDPYNSLITSIMTLCIPGIIHNLEKMRQIQCRYIYCLENEVKTGAATVDACSKLQSYQLCKYVFGEIFWGVPIVSAITSALNFAISVVQSGVLGIVMAYLSAKCGALCKEASLGFWCDLLVWSKSILDLVDSIDYLLETPRALKGDYCSAVGIGWGVEAW